MPAVKLRHSFRAKWVWGEPGVLRENAWVVLADGKVAEVLSKPPSSGEVVDLGSGLLLPGLINTHTHLELSFLAGLTPPRGDFVGWLEQLVSLRPNPAPGQAHQAALAAASQMAEEGVACVGDITNTGRALEACLEAGLSLVSFFEALGGEKAEPPEEDLAWQGRRLQASAVAAHAPYSVPGWRLKQLKARARRLPFCLHLAESQAEIEFFAGKGEQGARLQEFLEVRGLKRESLGLTAPRPLAHLQNLGIVDRQTLLIHGVQLNQAEIEDIGRCGASLCICPRSNLGLTGKMAPVDKLAKAGVNLALGTDSLASAPDLSLWAEMAVLQREFPALDPEKILNMATLGGARALGLGDHFGSLNPGKTGPLVFAPLEDIPTREVPAAVVSGNYSGPPVRIDRTWKPAG